MANFQFLRSKKRLQRFLGRVFQDIGIEESFKTIISVILANNNEKLTNRTQQHFPDFVKGLSKAIIDLEPGQRNKVIQYYYDNILPNVGYMTEILLYVEKDDFDLTVDIFSTFLDDFDRFVLQNKEDVFARVKYMRFLFEVMALPKNATYVWQNLLQSALHGNEEAIHLLKELVRRYAELPPTNVIGVIKNTINNDVDGLNSLMEHAYSDDQVLLPVYSDEEHQFMLDLIQEVQKDDSQKLESLFETFEWLEENLTDLDHETRSLWEIISSQAKFGLRASGFDRISLEVTGLSLIGLTDLQFFPDEETFPCVRVRFWVQRRAPFAMDMIISDGRIALGDQDERTMTQALLKLIALEAYFQIVMGVRPPRYDRAGKTMQQRHASSRGRSKGRPTQVRPMFRNLPKGQSISNDAALRSMLEFGYLPPEGKTFVRGHTRNHNEELRALMVELEEVDPLFTYSNDDLGFQPSTVN